MNENAKIFGIAGLAIAVLAIFMPFYTLQALMAALAMASIGAYLGDRIWFLVTTMICVLNLFLFSPVTLAALALEVRFGGIRYALLIGTCFLAPTAAYLIARRKRIDSVLKPQPDSE